MVSAKARGIVRKVVLAGAFSGAGVCLAESASAQGPAIEQAAAALLDAGVELFRAGELNLACPKFEQSRGLDPAVGTILYLAECYERTGRSASAWATYREAASAALASGQDSRALVAQERARKLAPSLSRVTLLVAPQNDMPRFKLHRDGVILSRAAFSVALPLDPGEHLVVASAPGYEPYETKFSVASHPERQTLSIPPLRKVVAVLGSARPRVAVPLVLPAPRAAAWVANILHRVAAGEVLVTTRSGPKNTLAYPMPEAESNQCRIDHAEEALADGQGSAAPVGGGAEKKKCLKRCSDAA